MVSVVGVASGMKQISWRPHRPSGYAATLLIKDCGDIVCPKAAASCRKGTYSCVGLFEVDEDCSSLT